MVLAAPSMAQNAANMHVSAFVVQTCTINATPLSFGSYDAISVNRTQPLDGQAVITVRCGNGTPMRVEMNQGANAQGGSRRMTGTGDFLRYELYRESARSQVWASGANALTIAGSTHAGSAIQHAVYGRVPAGQQVTPGDYTDTVQVTLSF